MQNTSMTKVVALVVLTAATTVGLLSGGAAPSRAAGASGETDSASSALTLFNDDVETGDHSRWTSATGLGEDSGAVHTGSWATRATSTSGTIAHSGYRLAARRADCVVPKVRGKKLLSAKKSIRRHHCRVGVITYRFSSRVAKRRVLAQNPPAHSHRKRGAKVKLVVSKGPKTTAGPCGSKAGHASTISKVMWILMENKDYSSVYNDSAAPYETKIANKCGLASNYHAVSHPSLPNYVALTSGSTQGITDDDGPPSHPLDVKSIYGQAYPSAQGYAESMPSNCDLSGSGDYAVRHNPWTSAS